MNFLFNLFSSLKARLPRIPTQAERDAAYLAESVDLYELEWRIRELDRRQPRDVLPFMAFGYRSY